MATQPPSTVPSNGMTAVGRSRRDFVGRATAFIPKLKDAGADEAVLRKIVVDNPRRFLAFVPKRPQALASERSACAGAYGWNRRSAENSTQVLADVATSR